MWFCAPPATALDRVLLLLLLSPFLVYHALMTPLPPPCLASLSFLACPCLPNSKGAKYTDIALSVCVSSFLPC